MRPDSPKPSDTNREPRADLIIVGGGLAGCLAFIAAKTHNPHFRIFLIERSARLGGNHTWCFHDADVPPGTMPWLRPWLSHTWPGYSVHFPDYSRQFNTSYHCIIGEDLDAKIKSSPLHSFVTYDTEVERFERLEDHWQLKLVQKNTNTIVHLETENLLLATGWNELGGSRADFGWQKFVGLEVELAEPHGLEQVTLMDATIAQIDGYRFFYVLPLSPTRLLVEDTYYSHHTILKTERIEAEIHKYIEKKGWRVTQVLRQESGCLPLPLFRKSEQKMAPPQSPLPNPNVIGAGSGFVHAITGYTSPLVLRQIQALLDHSHWSDVSMARALRRLEAPHWRKRFYRLLNRMLFRAAPGPERWVVFAQFYSHQQSLIERFYRGETSLLDTLRILFLRKPPVALRKALRQLSEKE